MSTQGALGNLCAGSTLAAMARRAVALMGAPPVARGGES
jgi:hypothetical protein